MLNQLKSDLIIQAKKQCDDVSDQSLVPEDLALYYALFEFDQVQNKLRKLIQDRISKGVNWDQIAALYNRVTAAKGRYDRAKRKVEKCKQVLADHPDDKVIQDKLSKAEEKQSKAGDELKMMNNLSEKVAAFKKSQQGGNHG